MDRLISRLTKLEQQSKTKIDPYLAEIQKMSVEEIRAERKRIEARLGKSNCHIVLIARHLKSVWK